MSIYSFGDVAYIVKNEITNITERYKEYTSFFAEELERDNSIVNCINTENYMLKEKNKFFVILKRHVELLPNVINRCVSTIDFEEVGTLYRIENTRDTSWVYASKLEETERYQTADNLRKKIRDEIEKINISLTKDEDIVEKIRQASKIKQEQALKEKREVIENLKADSERKLSEKDETIAAQANAIKDSSEENALLRDELNKYRQQEAEALRKKTRRRNIFRFIWSIVWKLGVLVGITALAIYLESKCNCKNSEKHLDSCILCA